MRIGIIFPAHRAQAVACAVRTAAVLQRHDVVCYTEPEALGAIPGAETLGQDTKPDVLISVGGDGTLLRTAKMSAETGTPLLGVNTGRLGFLTEAAPTYLDEAIEAMLEGRYRIDERSMLTTRVDGEGSWSALNDATVTRAGHARLLRMQLLVDGQLADQYMADGLIVATPTGSTGYSLSAGGPLVAPQVDCMIITPVCAHSLVHRPLVVSGDAKVTITLVRDDETHARLEADGQICSLLHSGSVIEVCRKQQKVRLIRLRELDFYERVRSKLSETEV